MKNEIVIFNSSNPESLKKKFKHNEKNPRATYINSANKEALKKALKGNKDNVVNYDDDLDLRKLKGDKVVKGKKPLEKKAEKKKVETKKTKKTKK